MTVSRVPNVEGGIQPTIVTAKGDLITAVANANPARLGVGSDGQLLTADSSTATGLSYQNNFAAGKNKIINGDFNVWQRGTSFTTSVYGADRWVTFLTNTSTLTRQTFTPGTAPASPYEGTYFLQMARTTSAGADYLTQKVEDVRVFAGQTVTLSFWAKADSACTIQTFYDQNFGSGGSTQVSTSAVSTAITTSWARYSVTTTLGSISGKTIGTSSYLGTVFVIPSAAGNRTVGFWGVQLEAGSTATAFQTATGTIQGELAACQRYYNKSYDVDTAPATITNTGGFQMQTPNVINNGILGTIVFPVKMRTAPSVTLYSRATGATGKCDTLGGGDHAANSAIALTAGQGASAVQNQSGGTLTVSFNGVGFHYVASAEL